jgi:hypothetical protein
VADTPTASVVNEALQQMGGNQPKVTGAAPTFDGSTGGVAAQYLYAPCVAFVARQWEWDFARAYVDLVASGNTPPDGWAFEYIYPTAAVQIWQVKPQTLADPNDPLPTTWVRGNALVSAVQTSVIWTDVANAQAVFNNNPAPTVWDPGFREAVVRLLASEFAIALGGRPDTSQVLLQSSGMMGEIAKARDS